MVQFEKDFFSNTTNRKWRDRTNGKNVGKSESPLTKSIIYVYLTRNHCITVRYFQ